MGLSGPLIFLPKESGFKSWKELHLKEDHTCNLFEWRAGLGVRMGADASCRWRCVLFAVLSFVTFLQSLRFYLIAGHRFSKFNVVFDL